MAAFLQSSNENLRQRWWCPGAYFNWVELRIPRFRFHVSCFWFLVSGFCGIVAVLALKQCGNFICDDS